MAEEALTYRLEGSVAVVQLDDGKANALSLAVVNALDAALDRAAEEARALLLLGRPGRLSAGFDLAAMGAGPESARRLVIAGGQMLIKLFLQPQPVVVACTGHALAAGALVLLAGDTRIGAEGAFKIGLNEVAIRMTLPVFGVELARERLSKRHFQAATVQARIYDPAGAVDAGYLDLACPAAEVEPQARAEAERLAELPTGAYAGTKERARGEVAERIRRSLHADVKAMIGD